MGGDTRNKLRDKLIDTGAESWRGVALVALHRLTLGGWCCEAVAASRCNWN